MRAVAIERCSGRDRLVCRDIPEPEARHRHVVIGAKAFGLNPVLRRKKKGPDAELTSAECVGLVKSCPNGEFPVGAKVAALVGGLGQTIDGGYAEYIRVPASHVARIDCDLPWAALAAIPGMYAAVWTCLFRNLEITTGQTLVVRGATSSFGQAAVNMAANAGARVFATTRNPERFTLLSGLGAERIEREGPKLSKRIAGAGQFDAVLDLVGNGTILDSLAMLRRSGRACLAGRLGGAAPIANFNPLFQMKSGVYLTVFGGFTFGTPGFPLSDVPLQDIARQIAAGRLCARPCRVFGFDRIDEAHRAMQADEAGEKTIVVL
jgi:NADPH2:quinone reductase